MNTASSQTKSKEDILSTAQNASETGIAKETVSVSKETDEMIKKQAQQIADLIAENDAMKSQIAQLANTTDKNGNVNVAEVSSKTDNYYENMTGKITSTSNAQVAERQNVSSKVSNLENRVDNLTLSGLVSNDFNQNIKPVLTSAKNKIIEWGKEASAKFSELKTDVSKTARNVKQACQNYATAAKGNVITAFTPIKKLAGINYLSLAKRTENDKFYDNKISETDSKISAAKAEMSKHTGLNSKTYASTVKLLTQERNIYANDKAAYDKYADTATKLRTATTNFTKSVATTCKAAATSVKEAPNKAACAVIAKAASTMQKGINWADKYLAKSDKTYTAKAETADKAKAEKTAAKVNTKQNEGPEAAD